MLVGLLAIMYLLLIRPQRKREKEINNMRNSVSVGDRVITIGGILAKVVKTTEDTLTLQIADKTKIEIMRWGISKNITADEESEAAKAARAEKKEEEEDDEPKKSSRPKRMKRAETVEEPVEDAADTVEEAVEEVEEAAADAAEEVVAEEK